MRWRIETLIAFLLVFSLCREAALPGAASPAVASGADSQRLPVAVLPVSYALSLTPELESATFGGTEVVTVDVGKAVSSIVMNAADLSISKATLARPGEAATPLEIALDRKREQVRFTPPQPITPGRYHLKIWFKGDLNDKLRGFYRSRYTDEKGVRRTIATTQMEPTDARRMFPCFDEPAFKATFQLTVSIPRDLAAISNAPVKSEKIDNRTGRKVVSFAETPRMSTYLVALVVGNFVSTKPLVVEGVPIRVWSVPGKQRMADYAQKLAGRLLPYFNRYFGIRYPAAKLDLIAIPDFEAGAMENLGAITFRETLLLVDDKTASMETRQDVAGVLAHEMAHMWFGDLVTMAWWDDLWLNEAFATWMSVKAVSHLMPQWHSWDEFGLHRAWAMSTDALKATRPIHYEVIDPEQANEMFDEITYTKGASILRMLEQYVGEDKFREGVRRYLEKHSFGNADTTALWKAVGAASGLPVPVMMDGWVNLPGYPLIRVKPETGREITLSQERFLLDPSARSGNSTWYVPVGMRVLRSGAAAGAKDQTVSKLLKASSQKVDLPQAGKESVVFANAGGNGYYRVAYPAKTLAALGMATQSQLSTLERLCLISDQWSLMLNGDTSLPSYLDLTAHYRAEPDPSVMSAMISQFSHLNELADTSARASAQDFIRERLEPARKRLGWDGGPHETDLVKLLRGRVLEVLGTLGQDEEIIKEARLRFRRHLKEPDSVDPNLLGPITTIVAYNGNENDYTTIRQCWLEAKTPEAEERNLLALGKFRKPELVARTLELCLGDEVRSQDAPHLLSTLMGNNAARHLAWDFLKKNWKAILEQYPQNMVPRVVSAASSMNTARQEEDFRSFFKTHPVPAGKRAVARTLERIHVNVAFRSRYEKELSALLAAAAH